VSVLITATLRGELKEVFAYKSEAGLKKEKEKKESQETKKGK
jgi:hypothetical protein